MNQKCLKNICVLMLICVFFIWICRYLNSRISRRSLPLTFWMFSNFPLCECVDDRKLLNSLPGLRIKWLLLFERIKEKIQKNRIIISHADCAMQSTSFSYILRCRKTAPEERPEKTHQNNTLIKERNLKEETGKDRKE